MARTRTADGGTDNERKEIPKYRVFSGDGEKYTVLVTQQDLHYLREAAIAEIDEYGSTRQLLYRSLSGQSESLARVFDTSVAEEERREEAGIRKSDETRIRLTDGEVAAVLYVIRDREDEWDELVLEGMRELGRRLGFQTDYERPIGL